MKPHRNHADLENISTCGYLKRISAYPHKTAKAESPWPTLTFICIRSSMFVFVIVHCIALLFFALKPEVRERLKLGEDVRMNIN